MFFVVVSLYPVLMRYLDLHHDLLCWGCFVFRLMLTEHVQVIDQIYFHQGNTEAW